MLYGNKVNWHRLVQPAHQHITLASNIMNILLHLFCNGWLCVHVCYSPRVWSHAGTHDQTVCVWWEGVPLNTVWSPSQLIHVTSHTVYIQIPTKVHWHIHICTHSAFFSCFHKFQASSVTVASHLLLPWLTSLSSPQLVDRAVCREGCGLGNDRFSVMQPLTITKYVEIV